MDDYDHRISLRPPHGGVRLLLEDLAPDLVPLGLSVAVHGNELWLSVRRADREVSLARVAVNVPRREH